jgi:type VI protein secretion system component Hcp
MEKIMTKTNDTWRVAALEDHRTLADSELDAVSGGTADTAAPKLLEACCNGTHIPNVVIEFA